MKTIAIYTPSQAAKFVVVQLSKELFSTIQRMMEVLLHNDFLSEVVTSKENGSIQFYDNFFSEEESCSLDWNNPMKLLSEAELLDLNEDNQLDDCNKAQLVVTAKRGVNDFDGNRTQTIEYSIEFRASLLNTNIEGDTEYVRSVGISLEELQSI